MPGVIAVAVAPVFGLAVDSGRSAIRAAFCAEVSRSVPPFFAPCPLPMGYPNKLEMVSCFSYTSSQNSQIQEPFVQFADF